MSNLRSEWQSDIVAAMQSASVMATVTATPGSGMVTVRLPDAVTATITIPKLDTYTPTVGDSCAVLKWGSSWFALGVSGDPSMTVPLVTSLPTASATYRGRMVRLAGATGVADAIYTCEKSASDTYSWVQVDNVSAGSYGILGTATNSSGQSNITSETAISGMSIAVSPPTGYLRATITLAVLDALTGGADGGRCRVTLKQGSTALKTFDATFVATAVNAYSTFTWVWVFTASSATYSLTLQSLDSGSGSAKVASGGLFVIEAVGSAS